MIAPGFGRVADGGLTVARGAFTFGTRTGSPDDVGNGAASDVRTGERPLHEMQKQLTNHIELFDVKQVIRPSHGRESGALECCCHLLTRLGTREAVVLARKHERLGPAD